MMSAESAYITKYIESGKGNVKTAQVAHMTTVSASVDVWHHHLGHISIDSIMKMSHSGMAKGMDMIGNKSDISTYCEECEVSGHTQSMIPKETLTQSNEVLGCIFSDVCEVQTVTHEGYQYFITFIDDHSQFLIVHPMKKKSNALEIFKDFLVEAECQSGKKLKIFHTNGGGEYFSTDFIQYLKSSGIVHKKTNPNTLQENGVAECVNHTLATMSIALLESIKSIIGCTAWPNALQHAILIKNIGLHSVLPGGISLYQLCMGNV